MSVLSTPVTLIPPSLGGSSVTFRGVTLDERPTPSTTDEVSVKEVTGREISLSPRGPEGGPGTH